VFDKAEKVEKTKNGFKLSTREGKTYEAKAIIVATGALGRLLNVPGEKEFMMRGLCYSAISYAPLFIERNVVVIGDTKLALRSTAELARIAEKVTLVAPTHGQLDTPMGKTILAAENVEVMEGYTIDEVLGDEYARTLVVSKDGQKAELTADAFFVELELQPQSEIVKDIVDLDEQGRIKIDARNRTSTNGLFAAGDVTDVIAEQVLIAVGEGAKATLAAYEYLLET
jgi:alkyl hydroperoxide reductase subunit F